MSLEDEFSAHVAAVKLLIECIKSFAQSVELYIHKLQQPRHDGCCDDPYEHLFAFVRDEAARTIDLIARIRETFKDSLLPITVVDPFKLIIDAIAQLREPAFADFLAESDNRRDEERVLSLIDSVRKSVALLRQDILKRTDAESKALFEMLKVRYREDNKTVLADYREEFVSRSESLRVLLEAHKDNVYIALWIKNDHDINRTLEEMRSKGGTEQDLIKLIGYIVRYEIVCEIAAAPIIRPKKEAEDRLSDENVRKCILKLMNGNTKGNMRWWFVVYRVLKDAGVVLDLQGFRVYLTRLFADNLPVKIDCHDLSKLEVLSFSRNLDKWDEKNAPFQGKYFQIYKDKAEMFKRMIFAEDSEVLSPK